MYEADVQQHPEPARPVRPREVKRLSGLLAGFGLLGLLFSLVLIADVSDSHGMSVPAVVYVLAYAQLLVSATQTMSGVFIWQGSSLARGVAVGLCVINILGGVVSLFTGAILPAVLTFALNAVLLRLLNHDEVRAWCDR